ncbi:hypothetical protein GCM10027034_20960 [Ramlibacter solisilvae]|uniref:DUF4214 domain-containing protein n=1 Tax=Ramlibacter tataouinensis TaxID=94132 RepID=UPI000776E7F2|nr:DUF4214 domain-containing protein [Ramlibacter tataouinensis]
MFEITPTTAAPYASVCYIRCDWADGSATRASGVVVGINDVLTALHVVFDESRGGWARQVIVYPGADTLPFSAPLGQFSDVGSLNARAANWDFNGDQLMTPQESAGDLVLIGMTSRIGEVSGWLPVTQMPTDFYGLMSGYPARGTGLMAEGVWADASDSWGVYDVASGLGPGASGGPLLYTAGGVTSVAGVLSSGDFAATSSTYAGLFGPGTMDWLRAAMSANDTLIGLSPGAAPASSPNIYLGSDGADNFTGTLGRDSFRGLGGDDVLTGGGGVDVAIYSGARASYAVNVVAPGLIQVADSMPWRDGFDTLREVERVEFSDFSLAFDIQGSAGQAYRLYQAAFDRAPDLPGLGFQMNALESGLSLAGVAGNFLLSPEYQAYGVVDDGEFVTRLYANVLHRAPDEGGLAFHLDRLQHGATRADILVGFSESPENQALLLGVMQAGMAYIG